MAGLIQLMRRQNVRVLLVEPYFDLRSPIAIGREAGADVVVLIPSVGGVKETTDYITLFDYNLTLLADAARRAQARPPVHHKDDHGEHDGVRHRE